MNNGFLRIGMIVRAHGVAGAVKIVPQTDDPHRFLALRAAFLEERGIFRPVAVSNVKLLSDGSAVLSIDGVTTKEQADGLKNTFLAVDREHAVKLPEYTYFVSDLIGCAAFDTDGKPLGKITDVLETGANDVYVLDGGKIMIPALKKALSSVDVENKRIAFYADVLKEVALYAD